MDAASDITIDPSGRRLIAAVVLMILSLTDPARSQPLPATKPITELATSILQLDDLNAETREAAAETLMATSMSDLSAFRAAVIDDQPISANQALQLHRIVEQIYLAQMAYPPDPSNSPFLGLSWSKDEPSGLAEGIPIRVSGRVSGFDANRVLRDGDTIIALNHIVPTPMTREAFIKLVQANQPGQVVQLTIERHGRVFDVGCRLRTRPTFSSNDESEVIAWTTERQRLAEKFWQSNFAALMRGTAAF